MIGWKAHQLHGLCANTLLHWCQIVKNWGQAYPHFGAEEAETQIFN